MSFWNMCLQRKSLISLCRGMGCEAPVFGLVYQSWFPPCRTNWQSNSSSLRIKSVLFIQVPVQPLDGYREFRRLSGPGTDPEDYFPVPPEFHPGSGSLGTLRNTQAKNLRVANGHNERCSWDHYTADCCGITFGRGMRIGCGGRI